MTAEIPVKNSRTVSIVTLIVIIVTMILVRATAMKGNYHQKFSSIRLRLGISVNALLIVNGSTDYSPDREFSSTTKTIRL